MIDDAFEFFMWALLFLAGVALSITTVFLVANWLTTAEGMVVEKYYDDPDVICSKGCIYIAECWTVVVDSEPWWNKASCVDESTYRTISVGDYFRE